MGGRRRPGAAACGGEALAGLTCCTMVWLLMLRRLAMKPTCRLRRERWVPAVTGLLAALGLPQAWDACARRGPPVAWRGMRGAQIACARALVGRSGAPGAGVRIGMKRLRCTHCVTHATGIALLQDGLQIRHIGDASLLDARLLGCAGILD